MTNDELRRGEALRAAGADAANHWFALRKWYDWCDEHGADLIALARQAQDNAKDAEAYRALAGIIPPDTLRLELARMEGDQIVMLRKLIPDHDALYAVRIFTFALREFSAAIAAATPGKGESEPREEVRELPPLVRARLAANARDVRMGGRQGNDCAEMAAPSVADNAQG